MASRRYQDLEVWNKARALVREVYSASASWPSDERYGITSQVRRAALSVMTNIAEGSGRGSDADFLRFLNIAYSSVLEVESLLFASIDLSYLPEQKSRAAFNLTAETGKMLNAFKAKLKK